MLFLEEHKREKEPIKMLKKIILIAAIILLSSPGAFAIHLPLLQRQRPFDVGFSRLDIDYKYQLFVDNLYQYAEYPTAAQIVLRQIGRTIPIHIGKPGSNSLATKAPQADMGQFHFINDPLWLNYLWLRID
jgi:hypothetical protein